MKCHSVNLNLIVKVSTNCSFCTSRCDICRTPLHLLQSAMYQKIRLIRSLKTFIFRYQDLVEIYSVSAETIINDGISYSENV